MTDARAWWCALGFEPVLGSALAHINASRDQRMGATETCQKLFLALNCLWRGLAEHRGEPKAADTPSFVALAKTMDEVERGTLLRGAEASALATLTPAILDHKVLNDRGHHPGEPLSDAVRKEASERHAKFSRAHEQWLRDGRDAERVLKKLVELLYAVRSNIQHGEKTPYGPDLNRVRRDELVSSIVIPVQLGLLERLLGRPSEKLVAYGTLRPGEANASVLEGLEGTWIPCTLRGTVAEVGGFPSFRWTVDGAPVPAALFRCAGLATRWQDLDLFEGPDYRRHLVTAREGDALVVANCFEGRTELLHGGVP